MCCEAQLHIASGYFALTLLTAALLMTCLQVLEGYIFLGSTESLGGEVAAAFAAVVDDRAVSCLREIVGSVPNLEGKSRACLTFQDLARLLPQGCFCACLREVKSPHGQ